jgi:hypothetical protein
LRPTTGATLLRLDHGPSMGLPAPWSIPRWLASFQWNPFAIFLVALRAAH